ncbi:lyase family protein [Glaciimonas sp. PCH181]|uniref:lyase family protein n=1 Tax=Glaciimonas sp. PCH181 TaxID=2133943 RepID=UPI000D3902F3|nr:lyase family protein [Glaciimonas sp. PCH181]PUA18055.1 aspartate ammonia-lyase [Glaciimonas sp. PCH181]
MEIHRETQREAQRIEIDSLGQRTLPADALFGIHSLRASENFRYSGETLANYPRLVRWLAKTKMVIAIVNGRNDKLTTEQSDAIVLACLELAAGQHTQALIVDALEGACGTSMNMNINEVIANRALQLMGHNPGQYQFLDPLDHVAYAQSTSDVLLTATKLALIEEVSELVDTVKHLGVSLRKKELQYRDLLRVARTCMQDCMPMHLGQAFGGYAGLTERLAQSLQAHLDLFSVLPIGGTGIGTGLGTYPGYRQAVVAELSALAGRALYPSANLFDAIQNMDVFAALSSTVKTAALSLGKVANDLILLSSGPHAGLNELRMVPVQAGSSMMPGKVNPVHAMGLVQTAYFVTGLDHSVSLAAANGRLETNDYMPLIAVSLFKSIRTLAAAISSFDRHCVQLLTANEEVCMTHLLDSIAIAPTLKQQLGYKRAAQLVEQSLRSGRTAIEIAIEEGVMSRQQIIGVLHQSSLHPDVSA